MAQPEDPGDVFISWAHAPSGADDAGRRKDDVLDLADLLDEMGITIDVDSYHAAEAVDWTRWGENRVRECDVVLCVLSREWVERWEGRNDPGVGAGAVAEANALRSIFQADQAKFLKKVKLVLLPGAEDVVVPNTLHGVPRFHMRSIDEDGVEELYRALTAQPEHPKPGRRASLRQLPPAQARRARGMPIAPPETAVDGSGAGDVLSQLLESIMADATSRFGYLPLGVTSTALNQPVRVSLPEARAAATSTEQEEPGQPAPDHLTGALPLDAVWWDPLRRPWRAVLLQGGPGSGKTWLVANHVRTVARATLDQYRHEGRLGHLPLPVLVECSALGRRLDADPTSADIPVALSAALIRTEACSHLDPTAVQQLLVDAWHRRQLDISLDGYDEMPAALRDRVGLAVGLIDRSDNRLLVAGRPAALTPLIARSGSAVVSVLPFSMPRILSFVGIWFAHNTALAQRLQIRIRRDSALRQLAANPLTLRFLCQIVAVPGAQDALPSTRAAVLEQLMLTLLSGSFRESAVRAAMPQDHEPEPELRLEALATAIGRLSDDWRAGTHDVRLAELERVLSGLSDYPRLRSSAVERWRQWHRAQRMDEEGPAPADPVAWEYLFDGVLVDSTPSGLGRRVRFAHPMLRAFCLARHMAQLQDEELVQALQRHAWFDEGWDEAIPLAAATSAAPANFARLLLSFRPDPWYEQRLALARGIAAAPSRFPADVLADVIAELRNALSAARFFDRNRAIVALADLVGAGIPEAQNLAATIVQDKTTDAAMRSRAGVALVLAGADLHLTGVRQMLDDESLPKPAVAAILEALVTAGDPLASEALIRHAQAADSSESAEQFLRGLPVEDPVMRHRLVEELRREALNRPWAQVATDLLIAFGIDASRELAEALDEPTVLSLRQQAQVCISLLRSGYRPIAGAASHLLSNPGLPMQVRAALLQVLLPYDSALSSTAIDMLLDRRIDWRLRRDLARGMASMAPHELRVVAQQDGP